MVYCLRDRLHGPTSILRGTDTDAVPFYNFYFLGSNRTCGFRRSEILVFCQRLVHPFAIYS